MREHNREIPVAFFQGLCFDDIVSVDDDNALYCSDPFSFAYEYLGTPLK
jgi:hypothetical protein